MFFKINQNSPENTGGKVSFSIKLQASDWKLYWKRVCWKSDSDTGVFLWIFRNFQEHFFKDWLFRWQLLKITQWSSNLNVTFKIYENWDGVHFCFVTENKYFRENNFTHGNNEFLGFHDTETRTVIIKKSYFIIFNLGLSEAPFTNLFMKTIKISNGLLRFLWKFQRQSCANLQIDAD